MELYEFVNEKKKLESFLTTAISNIVEKFKEKTGFSPSSINIHMVDSVEVGKIGTQYYVSHVTVDIDL